MKASTTVLILTLLLAHVQAVSGADVALGTIVTVSGNIKGINPETGSISVGSSNTYFVTASSVLTVNGKRGRISDLAYGMKVSGSAEVTKGESRNEQKRIIRMLTATTDPTAVQAQRPTGSFSPTPTVTAEEREAFKKKLSGTYWTVPDARAANGTSGTQWISLNADGTTTTSGSDRAGSWSVMSGLRVFVRYFVGQRHEISQVVFSPDLKSGTDVRFGTRPQTAGADSVPSSWSLIASPTPDMLTKISRGPITSGTASAPTPTPVPPAAESQQAAAEAVKANHNNLVFVTGQEGAGSGFIANLNGITYIVTNAHVAADINNANFKTLDGTVVPRGAAEVATGHDIFRMTLPQGGKPFEVMERVDANAGIGDEIVVLGNAEGSGVINTIMGKIVGIGPNLVEIDAQFVPGNSGSPIIHLKTGKVIGVATYAVTRKYDAITKEKMNEPVVRRFGFRIDSVKIWQPVKWQTFYAQAAAVEKIHTLTEALDNFFRDLYENKSRVTISRHTNPVIKTRISQWQESKMRKLSVTDRQMADANFISFLKIACQTDLAEVQRSLTYDYFQRRLTEEQETRNEMAKAFTEIIRSIRD